jgi:type IV pilus assembly protein PilM
VNEDVGAEIQKTLDFFKQISPSDDGMSRLYLTGGSAQAVHLKEHLAARLKTQVEIFNPFRKIEPSGRDVALDVLHQMTPTASVAVGLALRKLGD